jgi:hypothetical protein
MYFYVSLTVNLSITLANDQINVHIFNGIFITILYMYMFRAISCSSSGGQIVLIQHLVSSMSVSDRPVHRTVTYWGWRYQILYWYNLISWGWARFCSKHVHVEDCNKRIKICASSWSLAKVKCVYFVVTCSLSALTGLSVFSLQMYVELEAFDMDMSYTRVLHTKVAYRVLHKWRHAFYRPTFSLAVPNFAVRVSGVFAYVVASKTKVGTTKNMPWMQLATYVTVSCLGYFYD